MGTSVAMDPRQLERKSAWKRATIWPAIRSTLTKSRKFFQLEKITEATLLPAHRLPRAEVKCPKISLRIIFLILLTIILLFSINQEI